MIGFENNEVSMRKVFDFARTMGIKTIMTEPPYDDYSLIEKMVKETEDLHEELMGGRNR